jgi:hypothetical protein
MGYKGQTTVLSVIFVLVGTMFVVPAITNEKALADSEGWATGTCGLPGFTTHCELILVRSDLTEGKWVNKPTPSGEFVKWNANSPTKYPILPHNEKGIVVYKVGVQAGGELGLYFEYHSAGSGSTKCDVVKISHCSYMICVMSTH